MPKTTQFSVRDVRPEAGFVMTPEQVKLEKPLEMAAFLKRLEQLQHMRSDFGWAVEARGKPLESYVFIKYLRVHRDKDVTRIDLGAIFPSMVSSKLEHREIVQGVTPAFVYGTGGCQFYRYMTWVAVLDAKAVKLTGLDDFVDGEGPCLNARRISAADKRLYDYGDVGRLPIVANNGQNGVEVSFSSKGLPAGPPVILGIALSVAKVCTRCEEMPTPMTSCRFKMCKRCKDTTGLPVWYCSGECQLEDYPRHRVVCKAASVIAADKAVFVTASEDREDWAQCVGCGVRPDKDTIHLYVPCRRCRHTGFKAWYCGLDCQRLHYKEHLPLCKSRLFASGMTDRVAEICTRVSTEGVDSIHGDEVRIFCDIVGDPFTGKMSEDLKTSMIQEIVLRLTMGIDETAEHNKELTAAQTKLFEGGARFSDAEFTEFCVDPFAGKVSDKFQAALALEGVSIQPGSGSESEPDMA